ncbi:MAG: hypothetical protein L3J07_02895 [Candidatus Magasanikbacteria bacterium]|nr:hypothetical protein [Candidatus Magasanikbacteria bacterium]
MPEQITGKTLLGDIHQEWTIQEYEQQSRSRLWFILIISSGLGMVVVGVITGNFLFSLIIILFSIILFLQAHQQAPQIEFKISELGIILGTRFYSYSELTEFFIVYNPLEDVKTLFIETESALRPILRIPLLDENPLEIKQILSQYLAEDIEKEEPLSDRLARNWRLL